MKKSAGSGLIRFAERCMDRMAGAVLMLVTLLAVSCSSIDDERIPPYNVYLNFPSEADWITYGVSGAMQHRNFVKSLREPAGYPWTAMSATGFGGVLLCTDYNGTPVAYDLACPVECKQDVRIVVDDKEAIGRCPVCGSTYDIYGTHGYPLSGPAYENHYGLQVYRVGRGSLGVGYTVTR